MTLSDENGNSILKNLISVHNLIGFPINSKLKIIKEIPKTYIKNFFFFCINLKAINEYKSLLKIFFDKLLFS